MKIRPFAAAFGVALVVGLTACAPEPPPPTTPTDPWAAAEGTCFEYFTGLSFRYNGPKDTYGNAPLYLNGTCSGTPFSPQNTFLEATSDAEATAICNSIKPPSDGLTYGADNISSFLTPVFPFPNMYSCIV